MPALITRPTTSMSAMVDRRSARGTSVRLREPGARGAIRRLRCPNVARHRLHNETWGFDSNCFVCEPRNDAGLRIPFDHDDETDTVVAEFTLDDAFSGAPSYVHGGVTLAI